MADRKLTELTTASSVTAEDVFVMVDDPNGSPVVKKVSAKTMFGSVKANTVFQANVTISGNRALIASNTTFTKVLVANTVVLPINSAPASNNATSLGWSVGRLYFSNNYLYIAVNATTIKRVGLSAF